MDIMSKIQSKESLLQVLHTLATLNPTCSIDFLPVLKLRDFAGSTGTPSNCNLINELQVDASAFDAEPTPIDPRRMRMVVDDICDACTLDSALPTAVKQLSRTTYNLTEVYRNAKAVMLAVTCSSVQACSQSSAMRRSSTSWRVTRKALPVSRPCTRSASKACVMVAGLGRPVGSKCS